jgi:hypothetical protein
MESDNQKINTFIAELRKFQMVKGKCDVEMLGTSN